MTIDQRLEDLKNLCETLNRSSNAIRERLGDIDRDLLGFKKEVKGEFDEVRGEFRLVHDRLDEIYGLVSGLVEAQGQTIDVLVDLKNGHGDAGDSLPS